MKRYFVEVECYKGKERLVLAYPVSAENEHRAGANAVASAREDHYRSITVLHVSPR